MLWIQTGVNEAPTPPRTGLIYELGVDGVAQCRLAQELHRKSCSKSRAFLYMEWPGRAKSFVQIPRRAVPTLDALDALDALPPASLHHLDEAA
mgnify:CR=1 FL=1|jgi:hypothetical protein